MLYLVVLTFEGLRMPGIYRLKECPNCGAEHRKRGPYCSRSCGNQRTPTEEHKTKIADANRRHMASDSPSAEKSKWIITQQKKGHGKTEQVIEQEQDTWTVIAPEDTGYSYEIDTDGDLWR